jgi:hypothetical protein
MKKSIVSLPLSLVMLFMLMSHAQSGVVLNHFAGVKKEVTTSETESNGESEKTTVTKKEKQRKPGRVAIIIGSAVSVLGLPFLLIGYWPIFALGASLIVLDEKKQDAMSETMSKAFPFIENQDIIADLAAETIQEAKNLDLNENTNQVEIFLDQNRVEEILDNSSLNDEQKNEVINTLVF